MPSNLSSIQKPRDKYFNIVRNEIKKLKSGYGISLDEMAEKCGLSSVQFRRYKFQQQFPIKVVNKIIYFVK